MASRRQTPAVPLKLKNSPLENLTWCSIPKWGPRRSACTPVSHECSALRNPSGLDHAYPGVGEVGYGLTKEIRGRGEIGVEDGNEFPSGFGKPLCQRPGLESVAVRAADGKDGDALRRKVRELFPDYLAGVVSESSSI